MWDGAHVGLDKAKGGKKTQFYLEWYLGKRLDMLLDFSFADQQEA